MVKSKFTLYFYQLLIYNKIGAHFIIVWNHLTYLLNVFNDSYERLYVDNGVELTWEIDPKHLLKLSKLST